MSEAEANRLRQAMADAGDGIFSGDGPIKFKALARNTLLKAALAEARYILLRDEGIDTEGLTETDLQRIESQYSYSKVGEMSNEKANEYGKQLEISNPGLSKTEIKQMVDNAIHDKYGI